MKDSAKFIFLACVLAIMVSLVLWAYQSKNTEKPSYSRAFQHRYHKKDERKEEQEKEKREYHGTREKDTRKWQGDRYSTY